MVNRSEAALSKRKSLKAMTLLVSTVLCAVSPVHSAVASPPIERLVFEHVNLIDGVSLQPLRDITVVVQGGRIESVSSGPVQDFAGTRVIDLGGRWMLPGYIDMHAHLRDLASARTALRSGVTTVRSLGSNHFVDVGIRELHQAGASGLPHVVAAGYHIRHRMAEEFFVDTPELLPMMSGLSGDSDVRSSVGALAARDVDVIKVMMTERAGMLDADPLKRELTDAELAAAVAEAKSAGLTVAAHAHTDEAARVAVLAGVRTIEHGTLLSEATLALMRERGTCLVPTISFWQDMLDAGGDYDHPTLVARAEEMLPRVRNATALAWKMGVAVAAGSDMRYATSDLRQVADEVAELVSAGLPVMDAIMAATSVAARCLKLETSTGTIRPGLDADFVVLERDPFLDIAALRDALLVVNDGVVVIDRRTQPNRGQ
jgi:imidazolonepropionase-like amidohydrolase